MDGWLMDGLFALRLQVFLPQWLWSLHAPTTLVSWHCSTYCKWLRDSRGKFVISSQDQFEEQNTLQEQFAFRLRGSGPSTGLAVNAKNHFWKEIEMTFKVMENAWLCTCFPVVWIFHIQCSSIVTLLLVLVLFHISTCNLQPDADLRERLNLINGLQEVRAASLKRLSSVTEMPLCPIRIAGCSPKVMESHDELCCESKCKLMHLLIV